MKVIGLLRIVAEEQEQLRVGLKYSLESRQNYYGVPALTSERINAGLQKSLDKVDGEITAHQKRLKKTPGSALRKALADFLNEFPLMLIDHALRVAAFDPNTPLEDVLKDTSLRERLVVALRGAQRIVDNLATSVTRNGYIIAKPAKKASVAVLDLVPNAGTATGHSLMYEDFHPFRPQQFVDDPEFTILEFDGFNRTVDEFFSSIESQKLESRLTEREENAKKKLETARLDHQKRLGGLQQVQELNIRNAQAIEANLQKVQEATAAVNALISQGMDWQEIARLIEMEQQRHNVVADMIKLPLKLYENTATLLLSEAAYEDEDDFNGDETGSDVSESEHDLQTSSKAATVAKPADKHLAVDIDLALSAYSNARQYYEQKRSAAVKEQKTLQSSEKALKNTEKKINADLQKGLKQEKEVMRPQRKAIWFEKFVHFISSEGYLVLGGKDAQQNEILYKRYLKKGDIYIHADLHGAASVIVKNKFGMLESPIPPSTLSQAGTLAVATSSAWDSKAIMSAWWVNANQVSKTAPTGDLLPVGSFVIQGHKNFLPPAQLLLGFGIMFKVSEESKKRHLRHRVPDTKGLTLSKLVKDIDHEKNEQNEEYGMESQTEDQYIEADNDRNQEIRNNQSTNSAGSNSGDDSGDGASNPVRNNPLQPTDGKQSASLHPPAQVGENLARRDTGNKPYEATSSDRSDGGIESEQREQVPHNCIDGGQKRRLSTKERRLLRKGSPAEAPSTNTDEGDANLAQTSTTSIPPDIKPLPPRVRGKHGKFQKLKAKYADQDEEDRALAMSLLGSATAQEKATEDAVAKADKEKEFAAQKERRRRQHALEAEKGKEAEELRKFRFEEDIETFNDNELEGLEDLDAFVGAPLPGDDILDALVVCGPWDAIGGRYKWRVKLQPGTTKKGKAVKEILNKWNAIVIDREKRRAGSGERDEAMFEEEKLRMREAELIKAIREPEVIGVVPVGKVRVVMGQGEVGGKGKDGEGAGKGKRGGKGTKKQR